MLPPFWFQYQRWRCAFYNHCSDGFLAGARLFFECPPWAEKWHANHLVELFDG